MSLTFIFKYHAFAQRVEDAVSKTCCMMKCIKLKWIWYLTSDWPLHYSTHCQKGSRDLDVTSSWATWSCVSGLAIVTLSLSRRARPGYLDRLNCSFVNSKQKYNNTPNKTIKTQQVRQRPEWKYLCYPIWSVWVLGDTGRIYGDKNSFLIPAQIKIELS